MKTFAIWGEAKNLSLNCKNKPEFENICSGKHPAIKKKLSWVRVKVLNLETDSFFQSWLRNFGTGNQIFWTSSNNALLVLKCNNYSKKINKKFFLQNITRQKKCAPIWCPGLWQLYVCVPLWLKGPCCRNEVMHRGWNNSSGLFKWAQNEGSRWKSHLCRIGWKFGYKKVTFAKKWFESCAYVFGSKNTLNWIWVEYSSGISSRVLPHILPEYSNSP